MPESHQLTLDLFDSTALASGWTLDVPRLTVRSDEPPAPVIVPAPGASSFSEAVTDASGPVPRRGGCNFHLTGDRELAQSWLERARDNIAAIQLAARIEREGRPAAPTEQAQLIRFVGFGASDLANGCFRRPSDSSFRVGLPLSTSSLSRRRFAACRSTGAFDLPLVARCISRRVCQSSVIA
jgi:hypothetical protein